MSEDLDIHNLNYELFGAYLEELKIGAACKECGSNKATIMMDDDDNATTTDTNLESRGGILINKETYRCYVVTCFNCGHTRMFNANIVRERMKKLKGGA